MNLFNFLLPIFLYSFYSIGVLIKTIIKICKKDYDELEKKSIVDSLAITAVIIISMHFIEIILGLIIKNYRSFVVLSPIKGALNGDDGNGYYFINAFFLDTFIFSLIYTINRFKYGLITVKQILIPIIICLVIFIIGILPFFLATGSENINVHNEEISYYNNYILVGVKLWQNIS